MPLDHERRSPQMTEAQEKKKKRITKKAGTTFYSLNTAVVDNVTEFVQIFHYRGSKEMDLHQSRLFLLFTTAKLEKRKARLTGFYYRGSKIRNYRNSDLFFSLLPR